MDDPRSKDELLCDEDSLVLFDIFVLKFIRKEPNSPSAMSSAMQREITPERSSREQKKGLYLY